jgi:hypothetical protein
MAFQFAAVGRRDLHNSYDADGRLLWTSLPTTAATAGSVTEAEKTLNTYWDTGAIYFAAIEALTAHPNYRERWLAGVPAEQALYIALSEEKATRPLESETYEGVDGSLVVLDRDADGRVRGIEIA